MNDRNGQVAVVTGASLGVGRATISALMARGMEVIAAARDIGRLETAIGELAPEHRDHVTPIAADVRDESDVIRLSQQAIDRFGRIDVLVNSAGVSMSARTRLVDSTSDEWHKIIETNLTGTYLMCRACLPHLERSPDGYILNVQSTAAYRASPGVSLYAASKFGVRALSEALIEEYRNSNIRVTSVSPGPIDTNIWSHKVEPPSAERRALMLRPSDIADIVVWLLDRPRHMHIPDITVTPWTGI
ncbi:MULTISPECIES: SDR family oxidoreductase [unclassified Chelatococcus]|uniref:SDR family oxidoreductase n=1 Tax=unclassified Chelatococcus TaxID=2638111 RepID=UPI001BD05F6A|nr:MULTISPECIES: SDR family oxidoreductase [unclassified Chelatococcus]MBS7700758.1 SDR family oxidoreductase [Chelatococcus sp. YT9]MBX3559342.1 SDR family oxidoreductase [Chelatococcus sp.]